MKKGLKKKIAILIIVIFAFACLFYLLDERNNSKKLFSSLGKEVFTIDTESGFYKESLEIKIKKNIDLPFDTEIFYTIDGNDPTIESEKYINKIILDLEEDTIIYPLKVVAYVNGEYSQIIEKTYILDSNIEDRFDLDIISIAIDEKNLYDYYAGIFVPGVTYDENVAVGNDGYIPGNYNNRGKEWEKDAFITMFDQEGKNILEQSVKLSISGGTSAAMKTKSLKIISSQEDKFNLDLYSEYDLSLNSMPIEFKNLRLRSGSQDSVEFFQGNIRSSLASRLVRGSQFDGGVTTNRVVVYLNGKFYGIFDMQQTYSNNFIKNKFGLEELDKIFISKGSEQTLKSLGLDVYFKKDLNKIENRETLEKQVDMENYLLYFAIEILMNNTDWPSNNFEMWKYFGEYNENNPYTDGRYRFLIYDVDLIYNSYSYDFFSGASADTLISILENKNRGINSFFRNVMDSIYYRDKFVNIVLDLLNTSFKTENVLKIVDEEYEKIQKEISFHYDENVLNQIDYNLLIMKEKIKNREKEITTDFKTYFGLNKKYSLSIQNTEGIQVSWNQMSLFANENYQNEYYQQTSLSLEVMEYPGYQFKYWLVNGDIYYDNKLSITPEIYKKGIVNIEVVSEKVDLDLIINEVSAKSDSDWIKLTNIGNQAILLSNYFLSDNSKNLTKYNLPNVNLNPKESIYINGNKNYYAIGDYICNFNLSDGETLYLTYKEDIVDKMYIPKMNKYETYGRKDNSNQLFYFYNHSNERKN